MRPLQTLSILSLIFLLPACGAHEGSSGKTGADDTPGTCTPTPRAERPSAKEPLIPSSDREYLIDLQDWGIYDDGTHPEETTDGINQAIAHAAEEGYGTIRLGPGHYLVGKPVNNKYTGAILLPSNIVFALHDEAIIEIIPNDTWNYCVIDINGQRDVILTGGTIKGDRKDHDFAGGGAHDEGHTICIQGASQRVLIENTHLTEGTGDGVLILGGADDEPSRDITIRQNEISHHRRQGVSIVGGVDIVIEDNEIHHISGTSPQFGVDIESLHYKSRDILIANNHFHQNRGGDYVNTDGKNVWFVDNICDQTGLEERQTDGPIVHWGNTDQTIRGNTITVTVGSSNGRWGIIGYTSGARTNKAANYIEDNIFHGGGIHMADTTLMHVTGNTINGWSILGTDVSCLLLEDNALNYDQIEPYKFRRITGSAKDNLLNGEPIDLPLSNDEPFTNSPPHMW